MSMSKIITAALALIVIGTSAAVAQPARHDRDRDNRIERQMDRQDYRAERRDDRRDFRADQRFDRRDYRADRRFDRRDFRADRRADWRDYRNGRNQYRYDRNEFRRFHRGERFSYHPHRHVVINDWNRYHLSRPPRGYHWVRNGDSGDFLLVAITTGLILDLLLNSY